VQQLDVGGEQLTVFKRLQLRPATSAAGSTP
jgi:hypothetical protein